MEPSLVLWGVLGLAMVPGRRARGLPLILGGLALAVAVNTPHVIGVLPGAAAPMIERLTEPGITIAANALVALLLLVGVVRVLRTRDPQLALARNLEHRKDYRGAAEIHLRAGRTRRALGLFQRGRDWRSAAEIAVSLGQTAQAAELFRRAGGHHLEEAGRLFRELGASDTARQCDHELATWLTNEGRFDESIEAWIRAGEKMRAVRAAKVALHNRRLQPTTSAFHAARRAAEEVRDHEVLAALAEEEGAWRAAAESWRTAGDHQRAAAAFHRAGLLDDAAREQAASGHHREAARLRLQSLTHDRERLRSAEQRGAGSTTEATRLRERIESETDALIPLLAEAGMEDSMVGLLSESGRTEEAVARLTAAGQGGAAAELARGAQRWDLAAPILEELGRWGEASDVHELAGNMQAAARCAERAGEDARALELYRGLGEAVPTAGCLARLGFLQDALVELHRAGLLEEACELLQHHPGPVPDVPDVILDMAMWARETSNLELAVSCLQRAVVGVALQPRRVEPAVALARLLYEAGDLEAAAAHAERILAFDYSCSPAQQLRREIEAAQQAEPAMTAHTPAAAEAPSPGPPPAQQRYEILDELGRGGMGVVYRARDTRLEREVAIKVLRTTSPEEAARLELEAKAAATLNHPGIVTVYDFEAGFDGYFIAMEYVPGRGLDQLLRSDPTTVRKHLPTLLARLAGAVAYAHSRHVIHRDLKPGNVLVTADLRLKILDFGIAARLDIGAASAASVCGTPFYMAPEQIRGEVPTPATDIYAFGATAFHLATGRPPFARGNVLDAHLSQEPPDPRELAPDLPPALAAVILRCLRKDPAERFSSANELQDELLRIAAALS